MQADPLPDLRERHTFDGAETEYLKLALSLDVPAAASEGRQVVAVQLADQLVQLCPAAELGAFEQLADSMFGQLRYLLDADLGQAGEDSLAQGQFGDAHGCTRVRA
jgi:hypothetical protein